MAAAITKEAESWRNRADERIEDAEKERISREMDQLSHETALSRLQLSHEAELAKVVQSKNAAILEEAARIERDWGEKLLRTEAAAAERSVSVRDVEVRSEALTLTLTLIGGPCRLEM